MLWKTFFQILWTNICRTLVGELRRMRQGAAPILQGESARVAVSLDKIVAAMSVLSRTSQLMGEWTSRVLVSPLTWLAGIASHLAEIQQARATI